LWVVAGSRVVGSFPKGGESVKARWLLMATLAALVVGTMALAGTAWAVPDGTPPEVVGTNPADGATNVDPTAKIRVKFSEPMKDRTINPNNIYITIGCTEDRIAAKVDYVDEITPVRAVLKPLAPLADDTTYHVWVEGADALDGKGVKDATGTPKELTEIVSSFSTGDAVEPCN
jgi:Bacterial Ig-like domain